MLDMLQHGIGAADVALAINRTALGTFFAISGYHKLFNTERHAALVATFKSLGIPAIRFNQWWVPGVEMMGGLSLLSGVLSPFAAMGLAVICLTATCTDGWKRVQSYRPIDKADMVDDVLYLPEALYMVGLSIVILLGPGHLTLVELVF